MSVISEDELPFDQIPEEREERAVWEGYDHLSSPVPAPEDISEMLDELQAAQQNYDDIKSGNAADRLDIARVEILALVSRLRSQVERMEAEQRINGVVFLIQREGCVLMERCPKKRTVLGVGEWFIPGGKLDGEETAEQALIREVGEELGVTVLGSDPLPIVEGSPVPALPALESYYGTPFLMRPFVITVAGVIPQRTIDGDIELRWVPISEALESPVPQVRMMVAALRRLSSDSETGPAE